MSKNISEQGLQEIQRAYNNALEREAEARQALDKASEVVDRCMEALDCEHENVTVEGGIYISIKCQNCGWEWFD